MSGEPTPGERLTGEPASAWHALCHYRDLIGKRSVRTAWMQHRERCGHVGTSPGRRVSRRWETWSAAWGWPQRAAAHDAEIDRRKQAAFAAAQVAAAERHARSAQGAATVLLTPVRAFLNRLQDPQYLAKLEALSGPALLREARASAAFLPELAAMERLALGMTTATVGIEDRRDHSFANALVGNPIAVEHLIAALDAVAGVRPGETSEDKD